MMIICDIDGCIFENYQRMHLIPKQPVNPIDWQEFNQACLSDTPIYPVINLVKYFADSTSIYSTPSLIHFVTSRGEDSREQTTLQLKPYFEHYKYELVMRKMDDNREAVNYKRDVFHNLSHDFSCDSIVIDDHPGIIDMTAVNFPQVGRLLVPTFDCTIASRGSYG